MKKIIDYIVQTSAYEHELRISVLGYMNKGFELYGFPFWNPEDYYCQAVVKYAEESSLPGEPLHLFGGLDNFNKMGEKG